jgi:integrase
MYSKKPDPNVSSAYALAMRSNAKGMVAVPLSELPGYLTVDEAKVIAATIAGQARQGHDPRTMIAPPEGITVAKALDQYEKKHQRHLRQGAACMWHLRRLLEKHLNRPIVELKRDDVRKLITDTYVDRPLSQGRDPQWSRAHRARTDLGAFFAWCEDEPIVEGYISPARRIKLPVAAPRRDHVPTAAECAAIYAAAGELRAKGRPVPRKQVFIRMLLLTGCRRDEIADLLWSEIGEDTITIPAARYKSAREHTVPLTDTMRAELALLPRTGERVFASAPSYGCTMGNFARLRADVAKASGTEGWQFHDFRRAFSTHLANAGVEPHVIERALGHVVRGVAGIYNRAKLEDQVRAALLLWEQMIGANVVPMARTA